MVQAFDDTRPRRLISSTPGSGMPAGRVPPHNLEAEESLLGAMLLSRDAIASAMELCRPEDFYKGSHGHIFEAITSLFSQGEPADWVTVTEELRRRGLLEAIGDPSVFVSLQANTPSIGNAGALRPDRRGTRPAPASGRRGGRDHRARLQRPRGSVGRARPGGEPGVRRGPAPGGRFDDPVARIARSGSRPSRTALRPGRLDHRAGHRLRRSRRAALRAPALQPDRRRGPAVDGKDGVRRWAWWPTPG